jgi:hypothetical protein
VLAVALPHSCFFKIDNVIRTATWAPYNAIGPAKVRHERPAVLKVFEENNCLTESASKFHDSSMPECRWYVKYIFTKIRDRQSGVKALGTALKINPNLPEAQVANAVLRQELER